MQDRARTGPVDALVGPLELTTIPVVLSETTCLLQESDARKTFLAEAPGQDTGTR